MGLNKKYVTLWIGWIGAFFAIEFSAILNKTEGATLSALLKKVFGWKEKGKWYKARRISWFVVFGGFAFWMINHIPGYLGF